MNQLSLEQIKEIEFELLKSFNAFCYKNKIKYFIAYGTLLGAARHKGFIPWDDDIDIYMPREDYDRFLNLEPPHGTFLISPLSKGGVWTFAKLAAKGTRFQESGIKVKVNNYGVFIDITPLDKNYKNKILAKINFRIVHIVKILYYNSYVIDNKYKEKYKKILRGIVVPFAKLISKNTYIKIIQWLEKRLQYRKKYSFEDYEGIRHRYLEPAWFEHQVLLDFDDTKFPVPEKYESVLEQLYGKNWRTPIKREAAEHGSAYFENGFNKESVIKQLKDAYDNIHV